MLASEGSLVALGVVRSCVLGVSYNMSFFALCNTSLSVTLPLSLSRSESILATEVGISSFFHLLLVSSLPVFMFRNFHVPLTSAIGYRAIASMPRGAIGSLGTAVTPRLQ